MDVCWWKGGMMRKSLQVSDRELPEDTSTSRHLNGMIPVCVILSRFICASRVDVLQTPCCLVPQHASRFYKVRTPKLYDSLGWQLVLD